MPTPSPARSTKLAALSEVVVSMGQAERRQTGRKHVFVVNGAPEFLNFVRELLQDEEYNITTTNYVPETFDQIAVLAPDLLVIDLVVGVQAGWDLLDRLQAEAGTRDIPVIITSTVPTLLERAEADPARYGGQRLVAKPFDIRVLLQAVEELIGGPDPGASTGVPHYRDRLTSVVRRLHLVDAGAWRMNGHRAG